MYLMNEIGLDISSIGKILGHKDIKTTKIYSRMSNSGLKNSLRVIRNQRSEAKAM